MAAGQSGGPAQALEDVTQWRAGRAHLYAPADVSVAPAGRTLRQSLAELKKSTT